ncbi:hypothetical protein WICPIJ_005027 [Wickerhamomyces pijperi]|uniref:Protein CWH43 n=1 Tax=Wickerhamomyces pijperi TaxID=599730 RepID=A0A9P8TMC3_WICPI|nr:hypothetical protein WICPIJ_005027 [Wickerhamomyces pijperi]
MSAETISSPNIISLNGRVISLAHTICAYSAFFAALIVGVSLHYHKIVENAHYGYPDEWFPSVSATIGDRYPERSVFQILIALTSGPRFLLLILSFIRYSEVNSFSFNLFGLICGVIRTVTCGGWVYITSTDDHDAHDVFMIAYIVLTIPWNYYVTTSTPKRTSLRSGRFYTSISFFGLLVPLVYFFIQHKVHEVAGAYSIYAYFEWGLILLDVAFDAWSVKDLSDLEIQISSNKELSFKILESADVTFELEKKKDNDFKPISADEFNVLEIFSNIINSFIFWSVATSLPLVIWYFPLWNMGISGFELTILSYLSPVFLLIKPIRKFYTKTPQFTRILTVAFGVGSYLVEDPNARLLFISFGVIFGFLSYSNELLSNVNSPNRLRLYSVTFVLGLILSSIAKFWNYTNNPIWPIMHYENGGWNKTGILLGLIGAFLTPKTISQQPYSYKSSAPSTLFTGLGLGSLLFSIHALLTDSSTIITWVWNGYPITGPVPIHGSVSIIALLVTSYVGYTKQIQHRTLAVCGVVNGFILYAFHGWTGYIGGLFYSSFIVLSVPVYFQNAARLTPSVFFFASFVYIVLILAHVWIVAYAFVPAGWVLRERTDIVYGTSTLLLISGLLKFDQLPTSIKIKESVLKVSSFLTKILFSFAVLASIVAYQRFPLTDPKPYHPDSKLLTAGIWTIHFGLDNDMWGSEGRMAHLIKDLELDVIGLLESDTQRIIMGNRDLTQQIAEELNMYADFGPGPNKHTWGCALLSKFPIINSTHHLLPSPVGELAPAIHATLDVYGEYVDVVVFHSGQEEDEEDRYLQSLGVRDIMGSSDRPMILLSYLVTEPTVGNYNNYVSKESGMKDIDVSDWDRWCEYILYKKLKRTGYARISRGTITDTEVQVGKFVIEKDEVYSQERVHESDVEPDMRFPDMFYGEGVRGHAFHVFDEPRYYD